MFDHVGVFAEDLRDLVDWMLPVARRNMQDSDHRNCQRGDFDPCDCRRLPQVAAQLEADRLVWEQRVTTLTAIKAKLDHEAAFAARTPEEWHTRAEAHQAEVNRTSWDPDDQL